jgi:hypothetical protein
MSASASSNFNPTYAGLNLLQGLSPYAYKLDPSLTGYSGAITPETDVPATLPYVTSVDNEEILKNIKARAAEAEYMFPIYQKYAKEQSKLGAEETRQQMADLFPYLSAASEQATARNLLASKAFLDWKERQPTAAQARRSMAAGDMATTFGAVANQADVAKRFLGAYTGQTFSKA